MATKLIKYDSVISLLAAKQAAMTAASQVEAEAGSETALRTWSPLRVNQAIQALAGAGDGDVTASGSLTNNVILLGGGTTTAKSSTIAVTGGNNLEVGDLTAESITVTDFDWNTTVVPAVNGGAGAVTGILKANGSGTVSAAASGTDYEPARTTVSQSDAEAGVSTTVRAWTAERVKQAIDALAPGGGGSSFVTGMTMLQPATGFSVPSTWSLTGVNGIPTATSPDADYRVIVKIDGTVADPVFDPVGSEVADNSEVEITCATSGASIRYTLDGVTDPTRSSGTVYSGPITITDDVEIRAIAYKDYSIDSDVITEAFTVEVGGGSPSFIYPIGMTATPAAIGNDDSQEEGFTYLTKVTFPSAGTVTKLGIWYTYVNNATTGNKMAILDASKVQVGSTATAATILTSNDAWFDQTTSISIPSAGTYYIAHCRGANPGNLVSRLLYGPGAANGAINFSGGSSGFPQSSGYSDLDISHSVRAEFTP